MKFFSEVLMIACYMWSGAWGERSIDYFVSGNMENGWWALLPMVMFAVLGSLNLTIVKIDAKKEGK